ncbi:OsmC family protein [Microaerobacter geothermalis]|uniref:OsmC family protein n=1 Tax=Microaerobacter geothermalis TaxID=674972 RepID=UPI001F39E680|nr:OsmC family protein [Microaerobacter geothermalis]MCF6094842.1 OsmC family protein [Microaerobacter geothermalis]
MSNATAQLIRVNAKGVWKGGVHTSISVRDFPSFDMDEPPELGGTDLGPNPMEFVVAALNGCVSVMIALIAKEQEFTYDGVEFESTGIIDLRGLAGVEGVSPHFQKIRFDVIFKTEESEERISALRREVERRCPALNLLKDAGVVLDAEWKKG